MLVAGMALSFSQPDKVRNLAPNPSKSVLLRETITTCNKINVIIFIQDIICLYVYLAETGQPQTRVPVSRTAFRFSIWPVAPNWEFKFNLLHRWRVLSVIAVARKLCIRYTNDNPLLNFQIAHLQNK
jgi:hypothetical protein